MTLYEVDLDKLAVPVKSVEEKKRKLSAPKPPKEPKEPKAPKEPKEKKPRAKKVKIEDPKEVKEAQKEQVTEIQKEHVKEEPKDEVVVETVQVKEDPKPEAAEPPKKKARTARVKKDPTVPPQWFAKYVEGVKKEQATLKPQKVAPKQLKEEAKEAANKSWNNGLTRNRVENEVNSHMSRMYCNFIINYSYDFFKINYLPLFTLFCILCGVKNMKLTVEAIPTPKGFQHPAAKYDALPRHEFR